MNDITSLSQLAGSSDADAAALLSEATRADLAERILAVPVGGLPAAGRARGRAAWRRRRWLAGIPVAIAAAIAVLIATSAGQPGQRVGPLVIGPAKAAALTFTRHGRYIDVIVRNPYADPRRYRAEFRSHHLDITLKLVPASPSIAGTLVFFDGSDAIKPITAQGRCWTGGAGLQCPIGLRVPVRYRGAASMVFGRPARPGEQYESTTSATAPGEALHGLTVAGRRVSAVLAMLARRHQSLAQVRYMTGTGSGSMSPGKLPRRWFVYDATPWAPGQMLLFVGPTRTEKLAPPSPGTPQPSKVARAKPGKAAGTG